MNYVFILFLNSFSILFGAHEREENTHKGPKMHHVMSLANEPNPHSGPKCLHLFIKDKEMLTSVRTLEWNSIIY